MNLTTVNNIIDKIRGRTLAFFSAGNQWRRRIALFLAVIGPGIITSNVDNDAGGIATYTQAGSAYGYTMLWSLVPMTIALYVTMEMCARMGVITGKGLSDLIREEFGFRSTFFVMITGFLVDLGNVVAEFAGVAAAAQIFGVSKYIAVPMAAVVVWVLVLKGTYRQVEVVFLIACIFYLSYLFSALLSRPDWLLAARMTVLPPISSFHIDTSYLVTLTALVGTTIAPWQFFYLQAGFVEKKVGPRQYPQARLDVLLGSISCMVIVAFIIVCTAATLHASGLTNISDAGEAAKSLIPLAGQWAAFTFAFGLLNASMFAATILPLSTAHVICEGMGFEAGIDHKFREAPAFYWLYTILIVVGAGIVMIPNVPLWKIFIFSQVGNGVWLPIVVIFILLLVNRKDLMGEHTNTVTFNVVAWITAVAMIVLTFVLVGQGIYQWVRGVPG
ncbi:MAG TPA: Nramp family divalent metal transporter [Candidatus Acidoferrum sp.]|nr:Nramp family divalent metal transporter [Candidatus Acidoferrum sp.]